MASLKLCKYFLHVRSPHRLCNFVSRHFHGLRFLQCHGQVEDSFAKQLAAPLRNYLLNELDKKALINAPQMVRDILGCTFDEAVSWLRRLVKDWATCVY